MNVRIAPEQLKNPVYAIASKSEAHRRLILAAFCRKPTRVTLRGGSDDIEATVSCLKSLGAEIQKTPDGYMVIPGSVNPSVCIDARESGSTLRFLLPVVTAVCESARFTGSGRLPERPLTHLVDALKSGGVAFSDDKIPLSTKGKLSAGAFSIPGNISSQYVTGLLMALPLLRGDSEIHVEGELASRAYVDITRSALRDFQIDIQETENGYFIKGGQTPVTPGAMEIEGDWSNAAFFLTAGALSENGLTVKGLNRNASQGDKAIVSELQRLGASVAFSENAVTVRGGRLTGARIDIGEIPDLIAPLGVAAAMAQGTTVFENAYRLRLKESDRIKTMKNLILSMGGKAAEEEDRLIVEGGGLTGGTVNGENDHRIVMAAAIAGAYSKNGCEIIGAQAVNKSYPGFFEDFASAGGSFSVI